jgi:glycosyltransferase involved in cell wall biosynthesis
MHIALIIKPGFADSGVGRYTCELEKALQSAGHQVTCVSPVLPFPRGFIQLVKRLVGWDLEAFFLNYPLWAHYPPADLYHLTSQNLATLLIFRPPPGQTVVTVHDILPRLLRRQGLAGGQPLAVHIFDRLANRGLRRAGFLICVSTFTRQSLIQELGLSPQQTCVIPQGVNRPLTEKSPSPLLSCAE